MDYSVPSHQQLGEVEGVGLRLVLQPELRGPHHLAGGRGASGRGYQVCLPHRRGALSPKTDGVDEDEDEDDGDDDKEDKEEDSEGRHEEEPHRHGPVAVPALAHQLRTARVQQLVPNPGPPQLLRHPEQRYGCKQAVPCSTAVRGCRMDQRDGIKEMRSER